MNSKDNRNIIPNLNLYIFGLEEDYRKSFFLHKFFLLLNDILQLNDTEVWSFFRV